jgi:hypothetical protein
MEIVGISLLLFPTRIDMHWMVVSVTADGRGGESIHAASRLKDDDGHDVMCIYIYHKYLV